MKTIKKGKIFSLILLFTLLFSLFLPVSIFAHSVEIDPDSVISFPSMIINGKGNIYLNENKLSANYKLYYQFVQISNEVYSQIENKQNQAKAYIETEKANLEALKTAFDNAKTLYEQAKATDPNSQETKELYDRANDALKKHNDAIEKYNETIDKYNSEISKLTPTYQEGKWIQSEDKSFDANSSEFSDRRNYAFWVKVVDGDKTIYDVAICTVAGTQEETIRWSNFDNVTISKLHISNDVCEMSLGNITSDSSLKHQFYFYFSNEEGDIPEESSSLWTKAKSVTFTSSATNNCEIDLGDLSKLSYMSELDAEKPVYISVYEVVDKNEITSNTISGKYKLVLSSKLFELDLDNGNTDNNENNTVDNTVVVDNTINNNTTTTNNVVSDNTVFDKDLPNTGFKAIIPVALLILITSIIWGRIQYKKYMDIK